MKRLVLLVILLAYVVDSSMLYASGNRRGWWPFHGLWYYWDGNAWSAPYTRSYANGCYSYSLHAIPARTKGWRERVLELAAEQDDNRLYLEALAALGYKNAEVGSQSRQPFAAQGDSVYGYTTATIAELYGKADLSVLYSQAARLAESAQDLADSATHGHQQLVKEQGSASARVAEILARGQVAAQMLAATEPSPSVRIETRATHQGVVGNSTAGSRAADIVTAHCARCHSGDKPKAGFTISNLTPEWRHRAARAVSVGRMPKDNPQLVPAIRLQIIAALMEADHRENPSGATQEDKAESRSTPNRNSHEE